MDSHIASAPKVHASRDCSADRARVWTSIGNSVECRQSGEHKVHWRTIVLMMQPCIAQHRVHWRTREHKIQLSQYRDHIQRQKIICLKRCNHAESMLPMVITEYIEEHRIHWRTREHNAISEMQPCWEHAANGDHWSTLKNTEYIGELENIMSSRRCNHAESMLPIMITGVHWRTRRTREHNVISEMQPCWEHAANNDHWSTLKNTEN